MADSIGFYTCASERANSRGGRLDCRYLDWRGIVLLRAALSAHTPTAVFRFPMSEWAMSEESGKMYPYGTYNLYLAYINSNLKRAKRR